MHQAFTIAKTMLVHLRQCMDLSRVHLRRKPESGAQADGLVRTCLDLTEADRSQKRFFCKPSRFLMPLHVTARTHLHTLLAGVKVWSR